MTVYRKVHKIDCYALEDRDYVCIINRNIGVSKVKKVIVDRKTYKPPKDASISFPKSVKCVLKKKVLTCETTNDLRRWL